MMHGLSNLKLYIVLISSYLYLNLAFMIESVFSFFRYRIFSLISLGTPPSRRNVPQIYLFFSPTAFPSIQKCYPLFSSCASRNFKIRMHLSRFASTPLHITYVAIPGLRNHVGSDVIPAWFTGHRYFENELSFQISWPHLSLFEFIGPDIPSFVR